MNNTQSSSITLTTFQMKAITSMEKIMGKEEPTGEGMKNTLTLLQGETISFQLAYCWNNDRKERAHISISSPISDLVRVRLVQPVPCEYPAHPAYDSDYLTTRPGLYPDLLTEIPSFGFPLVAGHWKSLWIDIESKKDTAAGTYPVEISVIKDDITLDSHTFTVEVLNAALPDLPIPHTEWMHTDCISNYYHVEVFSEEYWRITENFVRAAVQRNCNMLLTPVFTPPLDTAVGGERRTVQLVDVSVTPDGYQFGYDNFRRWVTMCKRCGIKYYEISHLFTQWGASMAPKIMGIRDGKYQQIFGWNTDAHGKEYADFLHQFLSSFKKVLTELGISSSVYFHISDEPHIDHFDSYKASREIVLKDLEGYEIIDALSDYRFYEKGVVTQPICSLDQIDTFLENRPQKLWGYYCTGQFMDVSNRFIAMPGCRTRILGAMLYKFDLSGFLHWGFNFYNSEYSLYPLDPYRSTDAGGSFPSGDPFLVYPGENGVPEESIRIMLMDEAMNDLRAMKLLEQLAGRDAVMKCLEPAGGEKITFKAYPRSITYVTEMRRAINEAIKKHTA